MAGAEFNTIEQLVAMLKNGTVDAILIDMYAPVRRLDLFNGTWFEITEIVEKEISHGIILNGDKAMALVKDLEEVIRNHDVQSKFLLHENEEDEDHGHHETHEVNDFPIPNLSRRSASRRSASRRSSCRRLTTYHLLSVSEKS